MKDFNTYLLRSQRKEWSQYHVDYMVLKERLQSYAIRRKDLRQLLAGKVHLSMEDLALVSSSKGDYFQYMDPEDDRGNKEQGTIPKLDKKEALRRLSAMELADFCELLEAQVAKAATFYSTQLVNLAKALSKLDSNTKGEESLSPKTVGDEILELYCFVTVNLITLRQTLIRYDAFVRTYDGAPLSQWYLQRWDGSVRQEDHMQGLFHLDALHSLEASFQAKVREMGSTLYDLEGFVSQYRLFRDLLQKSFTSVERAAGGHIVFRDKFTSALRYNFLIGMIQNGLSLEPKFLCLKGRHLKAEIKSISEWRQTREVPTEEDLSRKMDPRNVFPLFLNLVSCFLFMMTNYIIEPSSAYYANALGASDALSGIMIGMAPWFALVSAVAYSMWTNTNYKHPILFAGTLMVIGNMMYACAYTYKSMGMCLIGRSIAGLGAPRVINRRYVADATPFGLRTAASAGFALATALGAALGPGMAIVLDLFEFEFYLPLLGTQYFNGMTGPGYFMALCWGIYTLCIMLTFKEPNRSGLDELRRREMEAESSISLTERSDTRDDTEIDEIYSLSGSMSIKVDSDETPISSSNPLYCFKHMTRAVALCMSLLFMKRIALESIVGSTSIITKNRYGWSIKNVGTLHFVNGCIVIPVSILAGWVSQFYEDRFLATVLLVVTLAGMLLLVDFTDLVSYDNEGYNEDHWLSVGPIKYIAGSLIAFSGIEACESYIASLISKVVPAALAVGTFNSGLLATLVGTSGRATGDLFITLMALNSIRQLLNLLIIPGILLVVISIVLIRRNYGILAV